MPNARSPRKRQLLRRCRLRRRRQDPVQSQIHRLRPLGVIQIVAQRNQRPCPRRLLIPKQSQRVTQFRIIHPRQRRRTKLKRSLQRRHQFVLPIRIRQFHIWSRRSRNLRAQKIIRLRDVHHHVPERIHLRRRLESIFLRRHQIRRRHHILLIPRQLPLHSRRHRICHRPRCLILSSASRPSHQ